MKNSTRILGVGSLTAAVLTALSAFAAGHANRTAPTVSSLGAQAATATRGAAPVSGRKVLPERLAKQTSFDRFIVKYKSGAAASRSAGALTNAVNAAAMRAGVAGLATQANGTRTALSLQYVRK
ncbi:MAG TPA: hypothetical protein VJ484_09780, partial [Lysobacter sp.]|nr:hypothetical protein [Lysobacter sp.]